eukprot:21101_4
MSLSFCVLSKYASLFPSPSKLRTLNPAIFSFCFLNFSTNHLRTHVFTITGFSPLASRMTNKSVLLFASVLMMRRVDFPMGLYSPS